MKKIMILTASTGGGHNQAAESLSHSFKSYGYEVIIVDFLKVTGRIVEKVVIGGYSILYSNLPNLYKGLYKYSNNTEVNLKISNLGLKIFEKKIFKTMIDECPDLIIGTHPFTVNVIGKLKKKQLSIPFISVITDFKAHRFYVNNNVDAYITASEYTRLDMMNKGICEKKIYPYGIPIKHDFFNKNSLIKKDSKCFTVLLMGGSTGIKTMEDVFNELLNCRNKIKIIVVCGKNRELYEKLSLTYQNQNQNKEVIIHGYTNNVPQLMEESDILISKPGGLTVSEALAKNLPMIIPYMLPGQEEENAEFLSEAGAAIVIDSIKLIKNKIDELVERPFLLKRLKNNMRKLFSGYTFENIIKLSEDLINEYVDTIHIYKKAK